MTRGAKAWTSPKKIATAKQMQATVTKAHIRNVFSKDAAVATTIDFLPENTTTTASTGSIC